MRVKGSFCSAIDASVLEALCNTQGVDCKSSVGFYKPCNDSTYRKPYFSRQTIGEQFFKKKLIAKLR